MMILPSPFFARIAPLCLALLFSDPMISSNDLLPTPIPTSQSTTIVTSGTSASMITKRRLEACNPTSNCVSSNYREPPNRYVSPFKIVNDPDVSFQRAVRDVKGKDDATTTAGVSGNDNILSIVEIIPNDRYIHLTVPGTAPTSLDDLELIFTNDGLVNVKCEARVTLPPPPFCIQKNCINGNLDQRRRVERLGFDVLGLPPSDVEEMKGAKWTPIFLNSDRVPGFEDD